MKIKIIDLLSKIANGDELPTKIKFHNVMYKLDNHDTYGKDYYSEVNERWLFFDKWALTNNLNDKAEIIEEIEYPILHKISADKNTSDKMPNREYLIDCNFTKLNKAIYKIIDELKELKRD